jgi:predicted transcriptional regulator of viral defense system
MILATISCSIVKQKMSCGKPLMTSFELSTQESKVVLALTERGRRESTRAEIVDLLGGSAKAADHVIESLRRKGWLQRATWGEYLLIPAEQGPDALGDSNLLALASRVADSYYIGFSTAAAHYGLTTQHRNVIYVVTPVRLSREVGEARADRQSPDKFFGFEPVDVFGYKVMISDREKTAIDCVDRPALAGRVGEAAMILVTASRRFDWTKVAKDLQLIESGALVRRFGWLADHVAADMPAEIRERLISMTGGGGTRARLGPLHYHKVQDAIGYDKTWPLFVNVSREELHGSAGLGRRKTVRKDSRNADAGTGAALLQ